MSHRPISISLFVLCDDYAKSKEEFNGLLCVIFQQSFVIDLLFVNYVLLCLMMLDLFHASHL